MAGGDVKPVEPVVEAVEEESVGTFSGQFRAFYIDRTYSGILENNRNSLAVGGWVGYDSSDWNGWSVGFKAYGVEGLRIHDGSAPDLGAASYDPSLYGGDFDNYGFFGEAYVNYSGENINFKIGRQKLNTPLAGADDARMLPNLFEAAVASYTGFSNTTLVLGHVTQESVGTFGNVYPESSLSLQSGYGLGFKQGTSGNFANMGDIALGDNDLNGDGSTDNGTSGVTVGAAIYKNEGLTLQLWDYYAWDILNAIYLSADYGWSMGDSVKMKASAQYINQSEVGDSFAGDVDSNYWGVKLGASSGALSGYIAYSQTGDSDGAVNGGIITPWGGMPAYTQGMVTRHQFLSGTDAWKVAGTYKFSEYNVKATAYYASFGVGDTATYAAGADTEEAGFDIQYQATEALNLRLRANYPTDFTPGLDWSEYRIIANYNF